MRSEEKSPLVSTEWLANHIDDSNIRIVDVRWRSRNENGRGIGFDDRDGYMKGHIPGAVFGAMVDEMSDAKHAVPDMLASSEQFALVMSRLGIDNSTLVVAYDDTGFPFGAARLWWALSYYGHDRVKVLDGGLRQWQREGRQSSTVVPVVEPAEFTPRPRPEWIANKSDVVAALDQPETLIIDCLTPEQYQGSGERHPWGQRKGHIPGAVNVPYLAVVDPKLVSAPPAERQQLLAGDRSFVFSPTNNLASVYAAAGVRPERDVITYCGRGYAAAVGLLALKIIGHEKVRLYDGSWSEWSADPDLPIVEGPSPHPSPSDS